MKNEEILKKAIEKALMGGYNGLFDYTIEGWYKQAIKEFTHYYIIFSHDFAKAFWGIHINPNLPIRIEDWQFHLQQMVLEKQPLKYLEKFL